MWETQTISFCAGRGLIIYEHDPNKFGAYRAKRQINPAVQSWRRGLRPDNPATIYNRAWLANHFQPSVFDEVM